MHLGACNFPFSQTAYDYRNIVKDWRVNWTRIMLMPEGFYFPHVTWPQIHACVIINIVLELIDWLILHLFINLHRYILLYYLASKHRMYLLIFIWRQRVRLIYTLIKSLTKQIINVGCIQTANPKRYNCIIKHPAYQIIDLGRKSYRT